MACVAPVILYIFIYYILLYLYIIAIILPVIPFLLILLRYSLALQPLYLDLFSLTSIQLPLYITSN